MSCSCEEQLNDVVDSRLHSISLTKGQYAHWVHILDDNRAI